MPVFVYLRGLKCVFLYDHLRYWDERQYNWQSTYLSWLRVKKQNKRLQTVLIVLITRLQLYTLGDKFLSSLKSVKFVSTTILQNAK